MSVAELVEQVHALDDETQTEFFAAAFEGLTVLRVLGLVKHLEGRWDVEAKPDFGNAGQVTQEEEEEEEQTEFDVFVVTLGAKKMDSVKTLRKLSGMQLKDSNNTFKQPLPVKVSGTKLSKDDAEAWKKQFEEAGCTVELK